MYGKLVGRAEMRADLAALHPGTGVADFVVDVLHGPVSGYFPPAVRARDREVYFLAIARRAATEVLITDHALAHWRGRYPSAEAACAALTRQFWQRLGHLRDRSRSMAQDHALVHGTAGSGWRSGVPKGRGVAGARVAWPGIAAFPVPVFASTRAPALLALQ